MNMSFQAVGGNQAIQAQQQPLALRQGQVFHGTIKQLFPDQMAEVQIGGHKMIAKLEVPLKAGDAHFFQVTGTTPQTELKVVTGPMGPQMSQSQQMNQLLDTMNVPKTADMQKVMAHFMKEQLPIAKEQLVQAESWLKNLDGADKQQALTALTKMVALKMPFTNEVFQALMNGQKTSGMTSTIQQVANLLQMDTSLPADLRQSLLSQINQLAKPFGVETGGVMLAKLVQTLQSPASSVADKLQALQVLKQAGAVQPNATMQNIAPNTQQGQPSTIVQQVMQATPSTAQAVANDVKAWLATQSSLTTENKQALTQLVERFQQLPATPQTIQSFGKELQHQLLRAFSANAEQQIFGQDQGAKEQLLSLLRPGLTAPQQAQLLQQLTEQLAKPQAPVMQNLMTTAEAQVAAAVDSKAMEHAMKHVMRGLGVSYEAMLTQKAADTQAIAQMIKPQLQAMLEQPISPEMRQAGEMLLSRMNGMQLLSGENGPQQQLTMQVPLEFFGKRTDATLQWSGRMKEDGKIDAAFARILFYLQMDSLQETMIDMQVQNRVVTVNLFNDNPVLKSLTIPFQALLKEGLAKKDYQLSAVTVKTFEEQNAPKKRVLKQPQPPTTGVDYFV